ncbi:MAG TPA: hypothetical protein VN345_06545 [Blastocatellia bacterium]|jgi:hypothetical protein|nr:hypothetical protein [Blastocatellia bacterium]
MKIEPSGVVFVGVCDVQTEKCIARVASPITAVWTSPARVQVNVCRPCLEEQVRAGEWEIRGAKIKSRVDVAAYSRDKRLLLVAEVKKAPSTVSAQSQLREWAIRVHRNLLAHAGIPSARYFLLAALPDYLYMWQGDAEDIDRAPDYEVPAQHILGPYLDQLSSPPEKASAYELESLISRWLTDVAQSNAKAIKSSGWLHDSGLDEAIRNGSVVMEAAVAA